MRVLIVVPASMRKTLDQAAQFARAQVSPKSASVADLKRIAPALEGLYGLTSSIALEIGGTSHHVFKPEQFLVILANEDEVVAVLDASGQVSEPDIGLNDFIKSRFAHSPCATIEV